MNKDIALIPHIVFLNSLPDETRRKSLLKILFVGLSGFPLLLIPAVFIIISTKYKFINSNDWIFFLLITAQDMPVFILTLLVFYRKKMIISLKQILQAVSNRSAFLICGVLLVNLIIGTIFSLFRFNLTEIKHYINSVNDEITINYFYQLFRSFCFYAIIAFFEEFIFRFTIFRYLRKHGLILALILSSLLFGIVHGSDRLLLSFLFGVVIALYYEYTNYFIGTVIIHALYNLLIGYYSYYLAYLILR